MRLVETKTTEWGVSRELHIPLRKKVGGIRILRKDIYVPVHVFWGIEIYDSENKKGMVLGRRRAGVGVICSYSNVWCRLKTTCMWPQRNNNKKLWTFFYSYIIILSFMFRPLDIITHLLMTKWILIYLWDTSEIFSTSVQKQQLEPYSFMHKVWIKYLCCEHSLNSGAATRASSSFINIDSGHKLKYHFIKHIILYKRYTFLIFKYIYTYGDLHTENDILLSDITRVHNNMSSLYQFK